MAGIGLRLVKQSGMVDGYTGGLNEFPIDPDNDQPIFTGDPVWLDASGFVEEAIGAQAAGDFTIAGVFAGCRYVDTDGSIKFRNQWDGVAGRSDVIATIAIPFGGVFHVRGAAGTDYGAAAYAGIRFGMVYNAGDAQTGDSRSTLSAATAAAGPLLVQRLVDLPNNNLDDEPLFECAIVRQQTSFIAP